MAARRCSICGFNWPAMPKYHSCPQCGEGTDFVHSASAMGKTEAEKLVKEIEFDRFYEEWDARRKGPSPDEVGAAEAREIMALERALEMVEDDNNGNPAEQELIPDA